MSLSACWKPILILLTFVVAGIASSTAAESVDTAVIAETIKNQPEQFKRIIANADLIRKELLQRIPPQAQNAEDAKQEKEFAATQSDPQSLEKAAHYLEQLARRVPPPAK